ncbi:uncharacterized protein LOC115889423 [Sitophilus oryzae]|uniref:Uncharacterized protein LOC115889423 n=1 Tax=Sitophilus oryzae TaxID=7048 RepID=A0A6J2YPT1_SITOR|nr:uncharacterized protein LOC115889423 [Sitophilus oryzae]
MQNFVDALLKIRKTTDIVPRSNKYVFANPGSADRWINGSLVLRKLAHKCGAKNPEYLTSTRLRKQIATILQVINFEKNEIEQMAKFMGHTEKTHLEFYRLPEDVYQTAKVAKVLLLMNAGKGVQFKGKKLADIELTENEYFDDDEVNTKDSNEEEDKEPVHIDNINTENIETENTKTENIETENTETENTPLQNDANISTENFIKTKMRHSWTQKQKQVVLKSFKNHIKERKLPKKDECLKLMNENKTLFKGLDWSKIKTLIYNTYRIKNL